MTLIVNYLIPDLIFDTAMAVKLTVLKCISRLCAETSVGAGSCSHSNQFSAPNYFFVSTKVAKAFPSLIESSLVLSYHSCIVSAEQSEIWTKASMPSQPWGGTITTFVPVLVSSILMTIGTQSLGIQGLIVHLLNPLFVGALAFVGTAILHSYFYGLLLAVGIFIAGVLCAVLVHHHRAEPLNKFMDDLDADSNSADGVGRAVNTFTTTQNITSSGVNVEVVCAEALKFNNTCPMNAGDVDSIHDVDDDNVGCNYGDGEHVSGASVGSPSDPVIVKCDRSDSKSSYSISWESQSSPATEKPQHRVGTEKVLPSDHPTNASNSLNWSFSNDESHSSTNDNDPISHDNEFVEFSFSSDDSFE